MTAAGTGAPTPAAPAEPQTAAWRSVRAWAVMLAAFALSLLLDLGTKAWAFARVAGFPVEVRRGDVLALPPSRINTLIPPHEPVVVVPQGLELKLVLNPGAVFGIGPGKQGFFILFTAVALAFGLYMFSAWTRARDHWSHACLGLILAGGVGNLYDRLAYGCVRDFLHPLPGVLLPWNLSWPGGDRQVWPYVSNAADAMLIVGIAALLIMTWRSEPAKSKA